MDVFERILAAASHESPIWASAVRPSHLQQQMAVFSPLAPAVFELGLETVYEAYLVHYGRPRLFEPGGESERILLGDYLYAHGLVQIAEAGGVDAVAAMAELISRCAALRATGSAGDGEAWVDAARTLGGAPDDAAIDQALERHLARVDH
jgi:hypothetical protein